MNVRAKPTVNSTDLGTIDARKGPKTFTYSKKEGTWVYVDELGGWVSGSYKKYTSTEAFDTGGYTGSWNSDQGRLALLHEKELVLNKDDTQNMLNAIGLVREIAHAIDLNALSSAGYLSGGHAISNYSTGNNVLEQQVHITAEFPNATDKNEIYEAFGELLNLASQYANRR
jgi:hypothetical protein